LADSHVDSHVKHTRWDLVDAVMSRGLSSEDGVEALGRLALPSFDHVAIRVRGQHDGAVLQEVLHILEREAFGEGNDAAA